MSISEYMEIDLREYQVARAQFFIDARKTAVTFSPKNIRFSIECIRKFFGAEYIELLVFPDDSLVAVRQCRAEHKNAIRWAKSRGGKLFAREINGVAYLNTIYELFGWDINIKYRLRGKIHRFGERAAVIFDARETEKIVPKDMAEDVNDTYVAAEAKGTITVLPGEWRNSFGEEFRMREKTRLFSGDIGGEAAQYNKNPDLIPTNSKVLSENISRLLMNFKKEG